MFTSNSMKKVLIHPSSIWIYPYRLGELRKVENYVSIWDVIKKQFKARMYDFSYENGENYGLIKFPKGIGVNKITEALKEEGFEFTIQDESALYKIPRKISVHMSLPPRDQIQKDAITFLNNNSNTQRFLTLDVGIGKTYCATAHISQMNQAAMIISSNLSAQWYKDILSYTDNLVGGKDIVMAIGTSYLKECASYKDSKKASIYITTTQTLNSYMETYGRDSLQTLMKELGIGIKVFDEAHKTFKSFTNIDLNAQVNETLYLTATPGRSSNNENLIYKRIYALVPRYGQFTETLSNHYYITHVMYDTNANKFNLSNFRTIRGFHSISYNKYLFENFGDKIVKMIEKFAFPIVSRDRKMKVQVITDRLIDIAFLKDMIEKDINNCEELKGIEVGTYCQLIKNKDLREKELKKNIILGTIGTLGTGRDIKNLQCTLCLTNFSSPILTRQVLGRLRPIVNEKVFFYDFCDLSVPDMLHQKRLRDNVFRYKNATGEEIPVIKIDLNSL